VQNDLIKQAVPSEEDDFLDVSQQLD